GIITTCFVRIVVLKATLLKDVLRSLVTHQVQKLMSLLNDKSGSAAHANMAVDVSELNITVGHLNGTLAKITHIGNLRLNNDVVLFDVLVIPEYCVSLLSVHKLIKDSKLSVSFDETKLPSSVLNGKSPFSLVYGREPNLSHIRSFSCLCFAAVVKGCDKFSKKAGKCVLIAKTSSRPNDDQEGPSGRDGNVHQPVSNSESQPGHGDQSFATPLDDENSSEGYGGSHLKVPIFENVNQSETEEVSPDIRRSSRPSKLPAKLNEFVLDGKVKYGLHRYANHTLLRGENYCFVTNLNKSVEPSSFEEASKDINWINAMNEELHALYENNTWELCDLPAGRKPIGSK
ncbi:ribonuclease H-like domain-containing protein, partial [Tanacetum coccineum]